ncbi:MAG: asparagine synthase (glutamine-hydrolyzing) [Chloroflexi bacterium]|nr:asparagine synthase (glutamine-hydrolyzing) [Chloroflexota bacterium]
MDGEPPDRDVLERMARRIAHRGPDGERFYVEGGLGLAHRRLRIIDLSDAAMQPMCNEDHTLWLILNGEIYNYIEMRPQLEAKGHRFVSRSDTEVLLHAYEEWGPQCLQRLNGMFAFALWDATRQSLFIARDRLGVKPLYYSWNGHTLAFASEIKAILAHPEISPEPYLPAIAEYMEAMYTTGEHTWFRGVKRLLPGHSLTLDHRGLQINSWWDLPSTEDPLGERSERYYVSKTRHLLEDSVRLRLRSDVPLGAHLSGGVDSSAVVALLSKQLAPLGEQVRTFSGAFAEGRAYDERRYVRAVVNRYHTNQHEIVPTADDLPRLMDRITWQMDEPVAGPGILLQWAVCELTRQSGVTVINGGQGGDEAWGGYFGYIPPYLKTLIRQARRHPSLVSALGKDLLLLLTRRPTRASLLKALSQGRSGRLKPQAALGGWAGESFFAPGSSWDTDEEIALLEQASSSSRTPLGAATYWDLKWYLPALLQVEDRTSMAFSLESRAPLLDYRLIEHAASVPSALKLRNLEMKHILRRAVKDLLPPVVYNRTDKMGMPTPITIWFRGSLAGWVREELLFSQACEAGLLSRDYIKAMLDEHLSGKADRSLDLWKMLSVTSWWRVFMQEGISPYVAANAEQETFSLH